MDSAPYKSHYILHSRDSYHKTCFDPANGGKPPYQYHGDLTNCFSSQIVRIGSVDNDSAYR